MNKMKKIIFATSNLNKLVEARKLLPDFSIENISLKIPELQGNHKDVALAKIDYVSKYVKDAVFIEDTCLIFKAFKELPGPYIKDFIKNIGLRKLHLLLDAFPDKRAKCICTIAYKEPGKDIMLFEGVVHGRIVNPKGSTRFDWDRIFMPNGYKKRFSEMTIEQKNKISHRKKAFQEFRCHFI